MERNSSVGVGEAVPLREGWYLMSVRDLEIELARVRGRSAGEPSNAIALTTEEALAFKRAGNVPDALGRSLRLVLEVDDPAPVALEERRRRWEPDVHDAPAWRRDGSVPVTVVPLGRRDASSRAPAWWEEPEVARLESEWRKTGAVSGVVVPSAYRGFVYKTVLALRAAGLTVSVDSIADSVSRWLDAAHSQELRDALRAANPPHH